MKNIAITASTGKVGSAILAAARALDVPIRSLGRVGTTPSTHASVVPFDFDEPATHAPALAGVDVLILISPSDPRQARREIAVAEAAHAAGAHVVKLSVFGSASRNTTLSSGHNDVEEHLTRAGIPATFLRPTFFMQNNLGLLDPIRNGVFPSALGAARIGQIDTADIAAAALVVAASPADHVGRAYDLTGSASYTGEELAGALGNAAGHTVRFIDVPDDDFRASLLAAGLDPWYADGLVDLYRAVRRGEFEALSNDVRALTGRAPRGFETWSLENAGAFRAI